MRRPKLLNFNYESATSEAKILIELAFESCVAQRISKSANGKEALP
jgi:hypothetical protein